MDVSATPRMADGIESSLNAASETSVSPMTHDSVMEESISVEDQPAVVRSSSASQAHESVPEAVDYEATSINRVHVLDAILQAHLHGTVDAAAEAPAPQHSTGGMPSADSAASSESLCTATKQCDDLLRFEADCWVCHCEGTSETLLAPCSKCTGSLKYIHKACLQEWILSQSNMRWRNCPNCKTVYAQEVLSTFEAPPPPSMPAFFSGLAHGGVSSISGVPATALLELMHRYYFAQRNTPFTMPSFPADVDESASEVLSEDVPDLFDMPNFPVRPWVGGLSLGLQLSTENVPPRSNNPMLGVDEAWADDEVPDLVPDDNLPPFIRSTADEDMPDLITDDDSIADSLPDLTVDGQMRGIAGFVGRHGLTGSRAGRDLTLDLGTDDEDEDLESAQSDMDEDTWSEDSASSAPLLQFTDTVLDFEDPDYVPRLLDSASDDDDFVPLAPSHLAASTSAPAATSPEVSAATPLASSNSSSPGTTPDADMVASSAAGWPRAHPVDEGDGDAQDLEE